MYIYDKLNAVRVIMDLNILLYKNGKELAQMVQINHDNYIWYGDQGSYSFILQSRSF